MSPLARLRDIVGIAVCIGVLFACGSDSPAEVSATGSTEPAAIAYYLFVGSGDWALVDGEDAPAVQPPGPPLAWYAEYRQEIDAPVETDRLVTLALYEGSRSGVQQFYEDQGFIFEETGREVSVGTQVGTDAAVISRSASGGTLTAFSTSVDADELTEWLEESESVGRDEWVAATSAVSNDD